LIRYFETERSDISVYNTLYDEAVALVEQFGVVSSKYSMALEVASVDA
jgi:hypothetical protein